MIVLLQNLVTFNLTGNVTEITLYYVIFNDVYTRVTK